MKPGSLIGPIIVAIGVVVAAIAFAVVTTLLDTADSGAELRMTRLEEALADKLTATVEIRVLRRTKRGEQGEIAIAFASLDELNGLERHLRELQALCQQRSIAADCGILHGLEAPGTGAIARAHVAGTHKRGRR